LIDTDESRAIELLTQQSIVLQMTNVADIRADADDDPITMLTAYDAPTARVVEEADIDMILVGDSVGNTVLGHETTVPVTAADIHRHTEAVTRVTDEPLVVADMPFLSYGVDQAESIQTAGELLKTAHADAVKIESGAHTVELTQRLTEIGIPVMAHLGLTPQHINQLGEYSRQGTTEETAAHMTDLAEQHERAGAFSLVLEHVPANVAAHVTDAIDIPTIGIGAGAETDGQVLVIDDILGISERSPPFSEQFGDVRGEMEKAVEGYAESVADGTFPAPEHSHVEEDIDNIP
jgi:ketopantoate hydroxymethyltransferase (EC 2.1.2.11)